MIIIGTMNLSRTRDRGNFYCPTCSMTQGYVLRARRPWLTIYFIPTVPVGGAELFVRCENCKQSWDPTVLEMDQKSHEAAIAEQFRDEALRAAVLIVISDGQISEDEIAALRKIGRRLLERDVDREELGRLCSIAQQNKIEAPNYVLTVSNRWSPEQKSLTLQAMFLAATADGGLSPEQTDILKKMSEILALTDREYESAIEQALTWDEV